MSDSVTTLYSRPKMYLASYDKQLDAASLYLNFLIGVFFDVKADYPSSIDIASAGHVFTISAAGFHLPVDAAKWHNLSDIFDVSHHQDVIEPYSGLEYLRPVVWFSEYCLISCTTQQGSYRQVFLQGRSLAPPNYTSPTDTPEIGLTFSFTLPAETFEKTTLAIDNLKQAIAVWEKREFAQQTKQVIPQPHLNLNWREQSQYHYSLRIEVS